MLDLFRQTTTRTRAVGHPQIELGFYQCGRKLYGRDILLVPERPGAREGVVIVMLTSPTKSSESSSPLEVALKGVLLRPLKTFSFG